MIGQVFLGRYEVQRQIGEGGMGRVYLGRQLDLGRQVVVKVMHDHVAQDPKFRDRFQRETLLMARFHHPGAVTLYDASLNDPAGPCIVMEYIKGVNLETLLNKCGKMTALRVGRIVSQLCEVLQAAHDVGMIHRDLKPANLMIVDPDTPKERVKVMDFGLAKLIDDGPIQKVTDTNVDFAVGTPGYIAPEQVRGETMDHRGDLYSVGVMMFELLTGRLPFVGSNSMDVLLAHATEAPPRIEELVPKGWVPSSVRELVYSVLAKNPEDRPQSARELGERLTDALRRSQLSAEPHWLNQVPTTPPPALSNSRPTLPEFQASEDLKSDFVPLTIDSSGPAVPHTPQTVPHPADLASEHLHGFHMEAWMPEAIAIRKLHGFVHDCQGEIVAHQEGHVRVRFGKDRAASASFAWLGFGKKIEQPYEMDLLLRRSDPRHENKLSIQVLFRPANPLEPDDVKRQQQCARIFIELRAYLMGGQA